MALLKTPRGNYIYAADGAVLTDYFWDRSEMAIIQGPIASGTSTGSCMKIWALATEQEADFDGVRRTRFIVTRDCFDDQTEILTEDGWRLFKDLNPGQKVAQLKDGMTEFVEPMGYHHAPYEGEMLGFEGEGIDFLVTPDHKMHVSQQQTRKRVWGDYELRKCEEIYGKQTYRVQRDAGWVGVDIGLSECFFEWLGFWFAEGHAAIYDGRHVCVVTQKNDLGYVRDLFDRANLPYSENNRMDAAKNFKLRVNAETKPLIAKLATFGQAATKSIPRSIRNAPPAHLRAFIKGYLAGDGLHNGSDIISTSSKQIADDLQEMALRAGYVANITTYDATGQERIINGVKTAARGPTWFVNFITQKKYRPVLRSRDAGTQYRGWYKQPYDGWVYCVEVPTHVIYVRRNGRAFWCSQTYKELRETTIKTWLEWFPESEWGPMIRAEPSFHSLKREHPSGDGTTIDCEVIFLAVPDADVAEQILASYEITGFFRNEGQFCDKLVIDELLSRCARYPSKRNGPGATWHGGFIDLNAPVEGHWIPYMRGDIPLPPEATEDEIRVYKKPKSWKFYTQPPGLIEMRHEGKISYQPNPHAENQRHTKKSYMEIVVGKTKAWIDRRVLNKVGLHIDGKAVYPTFSEEEHISKASLQPIQGFKIIVGLDFGRDPAAAFVQNINGSWRMLGELIGANESAEIFAPKVKRFLAENYPGFEAAFPGDPRGADGGQNTETTAYDVFQKYGMRVYPATSDNNTQMRRSAVEAVLARRNGFLIDPGCLVAKTGMAGGHHYPKLKVRGLSGLFADKPRKGLYSHIVDAIENALLGGGEGEAVIRSSAHERKAPSKPVRHSIRNRHKK